MGGGGVVGAKSDEVRHHGGNGRFECALVLGVAGPASDAVGLLDGLEEGEDGSPDIIGKGARPYVALGGEREGT